MVRAVGRTGLGDGSDRVLRPGYEGRLRVTGLTVQHGFAQSNLLPNICGGAFASMEVCLPPETAP